MANRQLLPLVVAALLLTIPAPASAYIGPGSGLSAIGAAFALIATVVVALAGFVWYPLKRLWRRVTAARRETTVETR